MFISMSKSIFKMNALQASLQICGHGSCSSSSSYWGAIMRLPFCVGLLRLVVDRRCWWHILYLLTRHALRLINVMVAVILCHVHIHFPFVGRTGLCDLIILLRSGFTMNHSRLRRFGLPSPLSINVLFQPFTISSFIHPHSPKNLPLNGRANNLPRKTKGHTYCLLPLLHRV
jgi:hypothetical protein